MQLLDWIGAWPGAVLLRGSGTAWLLVDAAHILGVGLLVGAIETETMVPVSVVCSSSAHDQP